MKTYMVWFNPFWIYYKTSFITKVQIRDACNFRKFVQKKICIFCVLANVSPNRVKKSLKLELLSTQTFMKVS